MIPGALGLTLLALGAWYLTSPGRTPATALADLGALLGVGPLKLTDQQAAIKAQIEDAFVRAGLGWAAPAAVANAYAESRLDPLAIGDNGHAVGLFQLNDANPAAAGYGMTVAARQDPAINIGRIIDVARGETGFLASRGATHGEVTAAFARYVERCELCAATEGIARIQWLRGIYGPIDAEIAL